MPQNTREEESLRSTLKSLMSGFLALAMSKLEFIRHWRRVYQLCKMDPVRGHETVHSDDGKYHIRLGNAITEPKMKIPGSSVAVFHATILKLKDRAPKHAAAGVGRVDHGIYISPLEEAEFHADFDETQLPGHVVPVDAFEEQIFEPRSSHLTSSRLEDPVAPVYEDGEDIIVKVFAAVPKSTTRAATEIKALQCLTEQECKHAPKHLGNFSKTIKTPDGTVGCVVRYVLMTQLPGYALGDGLIRSSLLTRHGVERAFDEAIKAVHDCGVDNGSQFGRNVLWSADEGKCYIVDFERAVFKSSAEMPAKWSNFDDWQIDIFEI